MVELARELRASGIRMIVDESFVDFVDGSGEQTLLDDALWANDHLVVVRSLSKAFGVAGLRLGVAATSDDALLRAVEAKLPIWNINAVAEYYLQLFPRHRAAQRAACARLVDDRGHLFAGLAASRLLRPIESHANFILCEVRDGWSGQGVCRALLDPHWILVKDCSAKRGFDGAPHVRITVRSRADNEYLLSCLRQRGGRNRRDPTEATVSLRARPAVDPAPDRGHLGEGAVFDGNQPAARPRPRADAQRKWLPRAAVLGAVVLALGSVWWAVVGLDLGATPPGLVASGFVEAIDVQVASEVLARIVALPVAEGQSVAVGQVVARLDDARLQREMWMSDGRQHQLLQLERERYLVRAPIAGVVTRVPMRTGEVVSPGQVLLTIANLATLEAVVYVRLGDIGRVHVGQAVAVTADPYPGQTFIAVVASVRDQAEYTPRNVQTRRERMNLVFGIRLRVDNDDVRLRPGMPIDARFTSAAGS